MKSQLLKGLLLVAVFYVVIAALRFLFLELGGTSYRDYSVREMESVSLPAAYEAMGQAKFSEVRNYASDELRRAGETAVTDHKYEKIATLGAVTQHYEADEQRTRSLIKEHNALIQEEAANGGDGLQWLSLTIGVPPGQFDAVVAALKAVGQNDSFQVTKTDKTNDYLELKAKRTTLEKSRDALVALKSQAGKIEELVKVEQEILALEDKIQNFGVQLGQFDKVNEFCTVRFHLRESRLTKPVKPHLEFAMQALQWTSMFYLGLLGCLFVGLLCVILVITIAEKVFRMAK